MLYFSTILASILSVPAISSFGFVGYIVAYASSLPFSDNTATLHPVLYPGSILMIRAPFTGGTMRSFSVFFANNLTASSSALCVSIFLISLSMDGASNLLYASVMVFRISGSKIEFSFVITIFAITNSISSVSTSSLTFRIFSFSPLFIASIL